MKIIPAIDLIDGKCVRLTNGAYESAKTYDCNPLDFALEAEQNGLTDLHVVDLDGAKSRRITNLFRLEEIASKTNLNIDYSGGVKSSEIVRTVLDAGASQICVGTLAVTEPTLVKEWNRTFGEGRIVISADCKNRMIATNGWLKSTEVEVTEFISDYADAGFRDVICTDISKDGLLAGPSVDLYKEILEQCDVRLVASGGVSSIQELITLKELGCDGAIVGKAIYEGRISLNQLGELC